MSKVLATYRAPANDDAVVTMRGVRFFDGQAVELDPVEHAGLIAKLRNNQHFEVSGADAVAEPESSEVTVLKAEHRGGSKFQITRGEEVLVTGLTKAEADAFNELDDEGKAAELQVRQQQADDE